MERKGTSIRDGESNVSRSETLFQARSKATRGYVSMRYDHVAVDAEPFRASSGCICNPVEHCIASSVDVGMWKTSMKRKRHNSTQC